MDVLKPLMLIVRERQLKCSVFLQSSVPSKFYIESKIYSEILFNIAQNAIKFNKPKGAITISVSFNEKTGKLWTYVEDTGIGIE